MFMILTLLAALISGMFVASMVTSLSELRRESDNLKALGHKHRAF